MGGRCRGSHVGRSVLDPPAFWKLREAGEVQVECMTWAGEPTRAGDLGHRAGEGCLGPGGADAQGGRQLVGRSVHANNYGSLLNEL